MKTGNTANQRRLALVGKAYNTVEKQCNQGQ